MSLKKELEELKSQAVTMFQDLELKKTEVMGVLESFLETADETLEWLKKESDEFKLFLKKRKEEEAKNDTDTADTKQE